MVDSTADGDEEYWSGGPIYTEEDHRAAESLSGLGAENSSTSGTANPAAGSTSDPERPIKRKPGRPKGSRNKKQQSTEDELAAVPKRLGRPPGTGHLQRARAAGTVPPEDPKRPVGRPRIHSPPRPVAINLGRIFVPGRPPPLRSKDPVDESNTLRISGGQFVVRGPANVPESHRVNVPITALPPTQEQQIIPESDSSEDIVFPDEEDEYTRLMNDGIGDDADGTESEDEGKNEEEMDQADPGMAGGDDTEQPDAVDPRTHFRRGS
ncbi:hypothetical protein C8R43DRAFT_947351 [Mycena crocata]|nr:hypothetical protein C8R43DRAFT_947351 [Mycena crocata]